MSRCTVLFVGCAGSKDNNLSFTLMHPERTLDLEASSKEMRDTWVGGFAMLTGKTIANA